MGVMWSNVSSKTCLRRNVQGSISLFKELKLHPIFGAVKNRACL